MHNLSHLIEEEKARFDEKFGKSVPNEYDGLSSEGRRAGCDDCETNQEERQEHKDFLIESHTKLIKAIQEVVNSTKEEDYKVLFKTTDQEPCRCEIENGGIILIDEEGRHKTCGKNPGIPVPIKTPFQQLKEHISSSLQLALDNLENKHEK